MSDGQTAGRIDVSQAKQDIGAMLREIYQMQVPVQVRVQVYAGQTMNISQEHEQSEAVQPRCFVPQDDEDYAQAKLALAAEQAPLQEQVQKLREELAALAERYLGPKCDECGGTAIGVLGWCEACKGRGRRFDRRALETGAPK